MTVEACRTLLGAEGLTMTDAEVSALMADTVRAVDVLYAQMREAVAKDADSVRWLAHLQRTGEGE